MSGAEDLRAFRSHPRRWEENLYVYPVLSRRARGLSIGVNLSPHKACNMDCVYCQVDRNVPATVKTVDLERVGEELDLLLELAVSGEIFSLPPFRDAPPRLKRLADIAFSGDGEPTSFRGFFIASRRAVAAKEKAGVPDLPIRILTNGIDLDREEVVAALDWLSLRGGEVWGKLDAGTSAYYDRVARSATPLPKVLANLTAAARRRPIVIQALFLRMDGEPPPEAEIDAWLARLSEILAAGGSISLVQVYTVSRPPAEDSVSALTDEELEAIAHRVRTEVSLPAETFGG